MEKLAGRYELGDALGQGRSTVFRAVDTRLRRDVAIKRVQLLAGQEDANQVRTRALREAQASARLNNPAVVTVYDVVEEEGAIWLVMELVAGPSLSQVVSDEGPLPAPRAAAIGLGVLTALEAAHLVGVVHRDVKPANVLVTEGDRAKLTDFGVATIRDESRVTATGLIVGSPSYMAPEQATGGEITASTDLWALGAMLYFSVEGTPPFQAGSALATASAVVHGEPRPQQNPGQLTPVISRLLVKDPASRARAGEIRAALMRIARDGRRRPRPRRDPAVGATQLMPVTPQAFRPAAELTRDEAAEPRPEPEGTEETSPARAPAVTPEPQPGEAEHEPESEPESEPEPAPMVEPAAMEPAAPASSVVLTPSADPTSVPTPDRPVEPEPGATPDPVPEPTSVVASTRSSEVTSTSTPSPTPPAASTTSVPTPSPGPTSAHADAPPERSPSEAPPASGAGAGSLTRERRRVILVVAGIVALLLAAVAVPALGGDDEEPEASPTTEASADEEPAPPDDTTAPETTDTTEPPTTTTTTVTPGTLPEGWAPFADPQGAYTIGLPPGWAVQPTTEPNRIDLADTASGSFLRIEWVAPPNGDPVGAWQASESSFRANNAGYEQIRIEPVPYRDYDAAMWEFRHDARGQRLHTGNLGFVTNGRGYALMLRTPEDRWAASQALFEQFKQAFQPT